MKQLDITQKEKISYCISPELRDQQIKININKVKARLEPSDLRPEGDRKIALVSFGPSLNDTWEQLRDFDIIMTCSGAHKFLVEKGILPTWHADLDPRDYKIKMLGQPQHSTEYLIASTIHPTYLDALKGYNVKLWHIFANDDEAKRILPKGEWCLTGGSSVGLRLMTLARFMGFTDFHIFGMDGNMRGDNTHTTKHVNAPPQTAETEYNGKKYTTTPSMLYVAKETFHELDQMSDVTATFYGEGLVQAMAKDYVPNFTKNTLIAFNTPETISKEYIDLNRELHEKNPSYGMGGAKHADTVLKLTEGLITPENKFVRVLDYGAGKGMLAKSLPFSIEQYDPAVPEISMPPAPADLVVCSDVLEHIEPDKLDFVLDDLRRVTKQLGYFVISTRKAVKTYSNGKNAHLIVQGKDWWEKKLKKYFEVQPGAVIVKEKECELHIIVGPKKAIIPDMEVIEKDGHRFKFLTPNETTKWRAKSLFTKEPITIEWIDSMKPGDIMFDVGANVGGYSIYAGVKGMKVYAFEPEADNYALLVKNMNLNGLEPNAYCLAVSNDFKPGTLYASGSEAGGGCNSFNEKVGPDLQARETKATQGCIGVSLKALVNHGLPSPKHIKIDVDGLEHNVIMGAFDLLPTIETILVEVNTALPQHVRMIDTLKENGFEFDQEQVDKATRKDGPFKGCAEYLFRKKVETNDDRIKDKIASAELYHNPSPHFFIENIFPKDVYDKLINNFPEEYIPIEKSRGTLGYPLRYTAELKNELWMSVEQHLRSGALKKAIMEKFELEGKYTEDVLLIRDKPGYQITPHTDIPSKVVSALFYLPKEHSNEMAGTSFYIPNDKNFTCRAGKHYPFERFVLEKNFPFKPNSLLVFLRTDNSFHGVEATNVERDVLLYNLRTK